MRLVVFCEDCKYEYSVIAYQVPKSRDDGRLSMCPRCKERSRIGFIVS